MEYLIQLVKWGEPIVRAGKYSFANFRPRLVKEVFTNAVLQKPLPDLPLTNLGYAKFEKLIRDLLVDKLTNMLKKYNYKFVGEKLELISSYLLGEKMFEIFRFVDEKVYELSDESGSFKIFPTTRLYPKRCYHPAYANLLEIARQITRRHLMTGLTA